MAQHDNYNKDILKALQRIATSLDKIEKHLAVKDKFVENYVSAVNSINGLPKTCGNCDSFETCDRWYKDVNYVGCADFTDQ